MLNQDPYQYEAIHATGSDIMVSASAGAGKTRVLVERLVKRCIKDRVGIDEILAVTFTAAAAAEMKNRVAAKLQEELAKSTDPELTAYLSDQMIKLETADITTIDSFCLTVISKYSNVIGLDPACSKNILSEGQGRVLAYEAYRTVLRDYQAEKPQALLDLLNRVSPRSEDFDTLFDILRTIAIHAGNSADTDAWYNQMKTLARPVQYFRDYPPEIRHAFFASLQLSYESIRTYLTEMAQAITESEKLKPEQLLPAQNLLANCEEAFRNEDYDAFLMRLEHFVVDGKTPADGKAERYTNLRKKMNDAVKSLAIGLYQTDVLIADTAEVYPSICLLLDMAKETEDRFKQLKRSRAAMDFTDMEHDALAILLANDRTVAKHYQARYKEVMVDEFQDTSVLQDAILTTLAKPGTIFRVGDVKQSIYRFRQAKPDLMRQIMHDENTKQITLAHNYRSKENVVEFCNLLFERIMNIPGAKDRYENQDRVTIGTERQKLETPDPIQFILIDPDQNGPRVSAKTLKAEWIASEIQHLIKAGYTYGDICVLVRSHHDKAPLRTAFDQVNIPYSIDGREGFYLSELCQTILAFLTILLHPDDDIALMTIFTSAFYNLSDEELAQLKIQYGTVRKGLHEAHPEISNELHELNKIAKKYGALSLLDEIARRHHFYERLDNRGKSNFDFLYEKAVQFNTPFLSIHDLWLEMSIGQDEKSSEAMSRGTDEQLVTVTTIHQSKGLQYKVVFLWSSTMNRQGDSSFLLMDDQLGIGMNAIDLPYGTRRPTVQRLAISYRDNIEDLEEYTRLLYVALTRAEEKMYIVDQTDKEILYQEDLSLAILDRRLGMTGLILSALQNVKDYFTIRHVYPAIPTSSDALPPKYAPQLARWTGPLPKKITTIRPSTHELSFLPELDPAKKTNYGAQYGTRMHEILSKLPNTEWTKETLAPYRLRPQEVSDILAFGNSAFYQKALTMDIYKELPFYTEDGATHTMGIIDFVAIGTNEILLLDFKTDTVDDPGILATRYKDQLTHYAKALHRLYPNRKVIASIWSLHSDCEVPIPSID